MLASRNDARATNRKLSFRQGKLYNALQCIVYSWNLLCVPWIGNCTIRNDIIPVRGTLRAPAWPLHWLGWSRPGPHCCIPAPVGEASPLIPPPLWYPCTGWDRWCQSAQTWPRSLGTWDPGQVGAELGPHWWILRIKSIGLVSVWKERMVGLGSRETIETQLIYGF